MSFAIFDLETGGLNPKIHAIVSVAVVFMNDNLELNGHYYSVVKDYPYKEIDPRALEVNGFTVEQIANGKDVETVMMELVELLKNKTIVNHNSKFDCAFLNERGFDFQHSIDTLLLSRRMWPGQKNSLSFACERVGIPVENAHNSLHDARMTAKLLQKFAKVEGLDALKPTKIIWESKK